MDPNLAQLGNSSMQNQPVTQPMQRGNLPHSIGQAQEVPQHDNPATRRIRAANQLSRNVELALNLAATMLPDPTHAGHYINPSTGRRTRIFPVNCGASVTTPKPRNAAEAAIYDEPQYHQTEYGDVLMGFGPAGAARVEDAKRRHRKAAGPNIAQYFEPIPGMEQGLGLRNMRLKKEYRHLAQKEETSRCVVS